MHKNSFSITHLFPTPLSVILFFSENIHLLYLYLLSYPITNLFLVKLLGVYGNTLFNELNIFLNSTYKYFGLENVSHWSSPTRKMSS